MTQEIKRLTSNFPSIFVDCETCFKVLFSDNTSSDHAVRVLAAAVSNIHNNTFKNEHHVVTVISESPKAE